MCIMLLLYSCHKGDKSFLFLAIGFLPLGITRITSTV